MAKNLLASYKVFRGNQIKIHIKVVHVLCGDPLCLRAWKHVLASKEAIPYVNYISIISLQRHLTVYSPWMEEENDVFKYLSCSLNQTRT